MLHYGVIDKEGFSRTLPIAKSLASFGQNVTLLTSQASGFKFPFKAEWRDNVKIISFPDILPVSFRKAGLGILNILLRSTYVLFKKFDIVHTDSGHRPSAGIPAIISKYLKGSVYISEWWDYFGKGGIYDLMPWWYRLTLGNFDNWSEIKNKKIADGVVALSGFTKKRAVKYGVDPERVLILHGGSDTGSIRYFQDTTARKQFSIPDSDIVFGFIGLNDGEVLDLIPFIEAVNELKHSYSVRWFATGKIGKTAKEKYKINDELIEAGWIDYNDYPLLLSCADVFLLLQQDNLINKARWPNKSGDYFAAGRIIFANRVGDICSLMDKYPEGFVEVEYDKDSVKENILKLIDSKSDLINKGYYNRKVAEEALSWKIITGDLLDFYSKIIEMKNG